MNQISGPVDLIKKSLNLFTKKENMIYLLKIYLPLLPFSIFHLFQNNLVKQPSLQSADIASTAIVVITNFIFSLVYVWVAISGIEGVRRIVASESLNIAETFKVGLKKYWKFLFLGLILLLIYILGFALLIVPGVIFSVWFTFARFILLDNNLTIMESLKKSKEMVSGNFFKVWGRLIVFGLFSILVQIVFGIIPYAGSVIISLLGGLLIMPSYLLYKELKS